MEILIPILAVTVIGLICAVGLAVASSVMAVKEDTRFTEIRACLPGANCGACGYTGCDGYAKALLEPGTKTNLCVPGADAVAAQIAALLGVAAMYTVPEFPAGDIFTAIAVGIVSGLSATGADQLAKQMKK